MSNKYAPLSGDVSQMFSAQMNPFTSFFRAIGSQFGLVNINIGRTSKPELEQRILDEVGSYGRQLGRIGDALDVLIKHINLDTLTPAEITALHLLQEQVKAVNALKKIKDSD